jgi:hypothetical protein
MIEGLEEQFGENAGTESDGPSLLTVLAYVQLVVGSFAGLLILFNFDAPFNMIYGLASLLMGLSGFAVFRGLSRVIELLQRISDK